MGGKTRKNGCRRGGGGISQSSMMSKHRRAAKVLGATGLGLGGVYGMDKLVENRGEIYNRFASMFGMATPSSSIIPTSVGISTSSSIIPATATTTAIESVQNNVPQYMSILNNFTSSAKNYLAQTARSLMSNLDQYYKASTTYVRNVAFEPIFNRLGVSNETRALIYRNANYVMGTIAIGMTAALIYKIIDKFILQARTSQKLLLDNIELLREIDNDLRESKSQNVRNKTRKIIANIDEILIIINYEIIELKGLPVGKLENGSEVSIFEVPLKNLSEELSNCKLLLSNILLLLTTNNQKQGILREKVQEIVGVHVALSSLLKDIESKSDVIRVETSMLKGVEIGEKQIGVDVKLCGRDEELYNEKCVKSCKNGKIRSIKTGRCVRNPILSEEEKNALRTEKITRAIQNLDFE